MKPATIEGYADQYTVDCERVLVTLLRGLGPWKESVFLVGGLTPRYLVTARPPTVPAHAGTLDVDIVIDLQILADIEAYSTLEDNLKRMRFERSTNERGQKLSWRWQTRTEHGVLMLIELLADAPDTVGGRIEPLPTKGTISALNIPHSSIAFDQRGERKDAHDLVYCIEHAPEGLNNAAEMFRRALEGEHESVIRDALTILRNRFAPDRNVEGYRKDGPVAVSRFELGEDHEVDRHEARILRQRHVSSVIEQLLARIGLETAGY